MLPNLVLVLTLVCPAFESVFRVVADDNRGQAALCPESPRDANKPWFRIVDRIKGRGRSEAGRRQQKGGKKSHRRYL